MEFETHVPSCFDLTSQSPINSFLDTNFTNGRECQWSDSAGDVIPADTPTKLHAKAAKTVQKVYRSYRTRRMLADSALVAEELWFVVISLIRNFSVVMKLLLMLLFCGDFEGGKP